MFPSDTPILLVDDMKKVRHLHLHLLSELGFFNVQEAAEGHEAFSVLENAERLGQAIGLVISDMRMPGVDGLQLLQQMKISKDYSKIPFILLVADSDKEAMVKALKIGANDCLIKPVSALALKEKLEKVFASIKA